MDMKDRILYSIKDMTLAHGDKVFRSGISFDICEGDCIMLCGANGSGKTTLMKTLRGISRKDKEMIMIPARVPKLAGFTLKEFVRITCFNQSDMAGKLSEKLESSLESSLKTLNLDKLADRDISTLSDGEFQKACIASTLVRDASVILLDEPTAFLDAENRIAILRTLRVLCDQGSAVIFSTHDLHDGYGVCTKVLAFGADGTFRSAEGEERKTAIESIFFRN